MLGRIGKIFLAAFVTELGGAVIRAGRGWLDRKLNSSSPTKKAGDEAAELPKTEVD